jgi:hypothetical protein
MFYSLLGRVVWMVAKRYLRRRYGPTYLPKPVIAGAVLATALAVALAAHHGRGE